MRSQPTQISTHLAELKKGGGPLGLLLLAVDGVHRDIDVVEQVGVVLDGIAGGAEDHDLWGKGMGGAS